MSVVIFVILMLIYLALPFLSKLIVLIGNILIPDIVPVLDEAIMVIGLLNNLSKHSDRL